MIQTARLTLEPLRPEHAAEMAPLLDDDDLHAFVGGRPATLGELSERYRRQSVGHSPDGEHGWLNWVVRDRASGTAVGTVQATVRRDGERLSADLAWVTATRHQGRGYASEAAAGMAAWLRRHGVPVLTAHVDPEHRASVRVAERLGLTATEIVVDGETRWTTAPPGLRDGLRRGLAAAMKRRDAVAVAALRSALAAIDNAETTDVSRAPRPGQGHAPVASTVAGLGAGEVERRQLTEVDLEDIVRRGVRERLAAAAEYQHTGHPDHAERLRREADVLTVHLGR